MAQASSEPSVNELQSLQSTLNEALNSIQNEISLGGYPSLNSLANEPHPFDEPSYLPSHELFHARATALAALNRLKMLVEKPYERAVEQAFAAHEAAALDVAVRSGIIDTIAIADDVSKGMSVDELHKKLDLDPIKINVVLRLLAHNGWVHETSEGVYAVTRSGLQLRKGHNAWKMMQNPSRIRIADSYNRMITHPDWKYSRSSAHTAYQLANNTSDTIFMFLEKNPDLAKIFQGSVAAWGDECLPGLLADFPWGQYDGKTVIDVGGGEGALARRLVDKMPTSKVIIQDLSQPVAIAERVLAIACPDAWEAGRLQANVHNFFEPQPVFIRGRANQVFILRYIVHNWADEEAVAILTRVAESCTSDTVVLIIENLVKPGTVRSVRTSNSLGPVPAFIPANVGEQFAVTNYMNMHMLGQFNSCERSQKEYEALINRAGLVLQGTQQCRSPICVMKCKLKGVDLD